MSRAIFFLPVHGTEFGSITDPNKLRGSAFSLETNKTSSEGSNLWEENKC